MRTPMSAKIFTLSVLLAAPLRAQCGPPSVEPAVRESLLVTTQWLAQHLRDSNLVIVQVDHMNTSYQRGHIPGARHANAMDWAVGDHDMPALRTIDSLVEGLGITNESRVVLYGDPWVTGWVYTALDMLGHGARTAVLDGGLEQWRAEQRPVATDVQVLPRSRYAPRPRHTAIVDAAWVRANLASDGVVMLDVRTPEEYAGTSHEQLPRLGHITGARHLNWNTTFAQPAQAEQGRGSRLKSVAELRQLFRSAGVVPGSTPVVYCTVGMRASHMYFVLKYLGYEPRMYDGSFADWSPRQGHPVTTGTARGNP